MNLNRTLVAVEKSTTFIGVCCDYSSPEPHDNVMLEFEPLRLTDACYINVHVLDTEEDNGPVIRLDGSHLELLIDVLSQYKERIKFYENQQKLEQIEKTL